jgi:hypothetical protein
MKITIDYDKGIVFPENKAVNNLMSLINKGEDFNIGSSFMLVTLRILLCRGLVEKIGLFYLIKSVTVK